MSQPVATHAVQAYAVVLVHRGGLGILILPGADQENRGLSDGADDNRS